MAQRAIGWLGWQGMHAWRLGTPPRLSATRQTACGQATYPILPVDGRLGQERQRPTVRGAGCAEVPTIQCEHSIDSEPIGED